MLYLFREHCDLNIMTSERHDDAKFSPLGYSFVGFITLFFFYSPFKKPKPGVVLRICQAMILPPYQRAGHGKVMVKVVYDLAQGKYGEIWSSDQKDLCHEIVEVNVEDPSPAFVALRNRIDYELLKDYALSRSFHLPRRLCFDSTDAQIIRDDSYFTPLADSEVTYIGVMARITPSQVHIVYELCKLECLQKLKEELKSSCGQTQPIAPHANIEAIEKK